ncbi:MAG: carbohydrate porin, partial [Planctomycetales bacterium]
MAALLLMTVSQAAMGQETRTPEYGGSSTYPQFGGPNSVPDQLADDQRLADPSIGPTILPRYFDWKDRLREEHGLSFSFDYTAGILTATETLGATDTGTSGAVRFFGAWDLIGRESGNTGTFVWKVENRHKYTDIPASGVASQIGYVGLDLSVLSNIGNRLTNLYWKQNLCQGDLEIIAGMLDTTDWVDIYALASPWTGFYNFAFATGGASIPVPDDAAIGVNVSAMLTDNLYILGGLADSNADSTDPFNGFDSFFNDNEYFTTIELGWTTSRDRFYLDNTHITFWHADERKKAGVSSGWGVNFSYSHAFADKWMPFVRAGYAKDGGSLLQKTFSTGIGYHFKDDVSLLGFGINWGQ